MIIVGETLSLAGSFDDFSLDEGAMVSIGQCLVGMDRPGVVNVITYTSDRLVLTVLCRVESTFEGGWMAFAVNNMDVQTPSWGIEESIVSYVHRVMCRASDGSGG